MPSSNSLADTCLAAHFLAACMPVVCLHKQVVDREGADAVEPFRQLCGPLDPELGRVLRPNSLRARFGVSRVRNAIHCTDLVEDGDLETSYFFSSLQQA